MSHPFPCSQPTLYHSVGPHFTTQRCISGPGPEKWHTTFFGLVIGAGINQHVTHSEPETFAENAGIDADTFSNRPDLRGSKV